MTISELRGCSSLVALGLLVLASPKSAAAGECEDLQTRFEAATDPMSRGSLRAQLDRAGCDQARTATTLAERARGEATAGRCDAALDAVAEIRARDRATATALEAEPAIDRCLSAGAPLEPRAPRSPELAFVLSLGLTATSIPAFFAADDLGSGNDGAAAVFAGLGVAALVFGPSAGHWYAGERFPTGLAVRLGAMGLGVIALWIAPPCIATCGEDRSAVGLYLALTAAVIAGGSVLYDIVFAPRAVKTNNAVAPIVIQGSRGLAPGLGVSFEL